MQSKYSCRFDPAARCVARQGCALVRAWHLIGSALISRRLKRSTAVCSRELAAWAEHALLGDLSRLQEERRWDSQRKCLGGLEMVLLRLGAGCRL